MKKTNLIDKIFLFSWPYAIIVSLVIFFITGNFDFVLSFLLGVASCLLMNSLNYRIMKNLYKYSPHLIKSRQIMIYVAKLAFFGVILYITHNDSDWNVYYTFAGLLTYRLVSIPVTLIFAKKEGDEDA
ncbi:MAG: ATP synthase subunit I [Candidatus Izemoplasmatales bacterium]